MFWNVVLENDFFLLLEYKAASSRVVSSFVSVVRRAGRGKGDAATQVLILQKQHSLVTTFLSH